MMTVTLSETEASMVRMALHNVVTMNATTLEALRKMSQRQADLRKTEGDVAQRRIDLAEGILARMRPEGGEFGR